MPDDSERREGIARIARELAHSGKYKDIMQVEAALIIQDHSVEVLQEPMLRAELELLLDDAQRKT